MAASAATRSVYTHVVEDVINKVRDEFISAEFVNAKGSSGETVLNELQAIWEMKMMQAAAIPAPIDINVPYVERQEEELADGENRGGAEASNNMSSSAAGKRKREDEEEDFAPPSSNHPIDGSKVVVNAVKKEEDCDGDIAEMTPAADYGLEQGSSSSGCSSPGYVPDGDVEPPLNEDDDEEDEEEDLEGNTQCLGLAQFDNVKKSNRNHRWRCTLKDGIMHINNRDILFTKATGDFDF